jgi:bifunctional non-homologous end joining protein LigD
MAEDSLKAYRAKRDFTRTSEPTGGEHRPGEGLRFVVQKHDASRLHFDFRLEYDGVLKSWAVTRGPSLDPAEKRLAVHVEDHPLDYGDFEGTIPAGEYGGGTVMLWDEGTWEPLEDAAEGLAAGKLKFILHGSRLNGAWALVRMHGNRDRRSKADNWLLIKERDGYAVQEKNPLTERALTSIRTGRSMAEIAEDNVTWTRAGRQVVDSGPSRKRAPRAVASRGDPLPPPAFVEPQMATLVDEPPTGPGWVHEIKYDGYRALTSIGGGQVIIRTRKGLDWTERFQGLVPPLADLPCRSALLDGEIAVQDGNGRTDFGLLQDALATGKGRLVYYLFDLLELDGKDLRRLPLTERKAKLAELLADSPPSGQLIYSDHVEGEGEAVFEQARKLGLEGIISKRADAPYRSERGKAWLKIKTGLGQEFIVIGWEPSEVKGKPFSAILTAVREGGKLSYRGKVGSGFSHRDIEQVWPELQKREVSKPPADDFPLAVRR